MEKRVKKIALTKKAYRFLFISLIFPLLLPVILTTFLFSKTQHKPATQIPLPSPMHGGEVVKAKLVIDGDTIQIDTGESVRYIGINTPELKDERGEIQCFAKEALQKNKELVENKFIELEKDISETDKYGRLLRYIWIGDRLINEELVREGYAHSATFPPDIKYQQRFIEAARLAQNENRGFWGIGCTAF